MTLPFLVLYFILGLLFGSFLSMLIPRLHSGKKGAWLGRSECPQCETTLAPRDLIPLISFFVQKGRCRSCKTSISWHYPITELSTGLLFITFAWAGFSPLPLYFIYGIILIFIFFFDLRYLEIPDEVMIPGIIIASIATLHPNTPTWTDALLGAGVILTFFLLQIILSRGKWLGGGDLRIGAFMGLILGFQLTLVATFMSYIIGSIISLGLIASGTLSRKSMIPFGPFLVLGTLIALLYGHALIEWYFDFIYMN